MSSVRSKSTRGRHRSLRRNPLTFSMRQKKKERSEIRKNKTCSVLAETVAVLDNPAENIPHEQFQSLDHAEAEDLSPVQEEAAFSPAATKANSLLSDPLNMYDPASIFPHTNKPHGTKQNTIDEESRQWESFFDPQHSFGSFQHAISKPVASHQYFYKGKWPLDPKDLVGMVPQKNNSSTATTFLFPSAPEPTLPNLQHLQQYINTPLLQEEEIVSVEGSMASLGQIEILPCPSLSSFPKYKKPAAENDQSLWKDRLQLLNTIQLQGFREEWNGTQKELYMLSKAARLQRQLKHKAEKMKREALVHSSMNDEVCNTSGMKDGVHQVAIEPDTMLQEDLRTLSHCNDDEGKKEQSSLASLDEKENDLFTSTKKDDVENQMNEKRPDIKKKTRVSFLLFFIGFFFPPLWVIGAVYTPTIQRTSSSKKIDQKWRKLSRNAVFVFLVLVAAVVVLLVAFKPQAIGFRNSNEGGYQDERVVFDENDSNFAAGQHITI